MKFHRLLAMAFLSIALFPLSACGTLISKDTASKVRDAAVKACASGAQLEAAWIIGKEGGVFTKEDTIRKVDAAFEAFKISCDSAEDFESGIAITQLAVLYVRLKPVIDELKT